MPLFVVVSGDQDSSVLSIDTDRCVIGNSAQADLRLTSPFVSREHMEVVKAEGGWVLKDLESKNGTRLNGKRIDSDGSWLTDGDTVELANGSVVLQYRSGTSTITLLDTAEYDFAIRVDASEREVYRGQERIVPPLSKKEFDVAHLLYANRGKACSRDDVRAAGWPERKVYEVEDNEVDVMLRRIRLRIESDPRNPQFIKTIKGFGFKMEDQSPGS